jgi:hypothetical protein
MRTISFEYLESIKDDEKRQVQRFRLDLEVAADQSGWMDSWADLLGDRDTPACTSCQVPFETNEWVFHPKQGFHAVECVECRLAGMSEPPSVPEVLL